MSIEWKGLRVLVTGAGSGIGKALATAAGSRGARVAVVDVEPERSESAAAELRAGGADAVAYACDVSDAEAVDALAERVRQDLGGLDVLFNNAGVGMGGPIDRISPADASWVVSVNLLGVINGVRAFSPLLREAAGQGRPAWIVNTGSEHSLGIPTIGASNVYTATKHAVLGLTDVLRHDFKDSGVRTAVLCPGLVDTRIYDAARNRPERFGGAAPIPARFEERMQAVMATGQDPALTAQLCFEGLDRGDFLIIADPNVRPFVDARIAEVERAVAQIEARLPGGSRNGRS